MRKFESDTKADGVWRTISGRRIFIAEGQSLVEAMRSSKKFNNTEIKEQKDKKYGDGKEPDEDFLKRYTEGDFDSAYIVAQQLIEGKEVDDDKYRTGNGTEHAKETRRLLDKINSSEPSDTVLVRYENGKLHSPPKEGDTVSIGLRSFSRDMDFVNKVAVGEDKGIKAFSDDIVEYRTEGKIKSFDISGYSKFKQEESLVSGDFTVNKVEKVKTEYEDKKGRIAVFEKTVVYIEQK